MSWLKDLFETYENCTSEVGVIQENAPVLLPVAHSTQNAQIEITLSECGAFRKAAVVPKADAVTIIPVTEDSSSRSGKAILPHPLADKIEYIAGDLKMFSPKDNSEKYSVYVKQLEEWCSSEISLPQVRAVLTYVKQETMVEDLVSAQIFETEDGVLTNKKIEQIVQGDCFVRFSVETPLERSESRLYRDHDVFESYVAFDLERQTIQELCYVTGKMLPRAVKHPAKIRNTGDKAKLISANDSSGFTYRGRLTESSQAAVVGYEVSQKAHHALRWLAAKQGIRVGEQTLIVWSAKKVEVDKPWFEMLIENKENEAFTNDIYAQQVRKAVYGNYRDLKPLDSMIIMSVEAATIGRLSIPFYEKMEASRFRENLTHWYETCYWPYYNKKTETLYTGTPSVFDIAKIAYGEEMSDKLLKSTIERLVPCVVKRKAIPLDVVKSAVANAQNPLKYDQKYKWERAIYVACALIKKSYMDRNDTRRASIMGLDESIRDRSYLYGRLLAVAEKLERTVLNSQKVKRNTAAERYFQQFQKCPRQTWRVITNCLDPYIRKLKGKDRFFYPDYLDTIMSQFEVEDFDNNQRLDDLFLLGYSAQMEQLRYKKENAKEN